MGLEDFDMVDNSASNVEKKDSDEKFVDKFDFDTLLFYYDNLDKLIQLLEESHCDYLNSKIKYEYKKHEHQTTINWSEENALREINNLPKVTNKEQRESVIELKVKSLYIDMVELKKKYDMYKKIFNFIDKNYELFGKSCDCVNCKGEENDVN